MFPAGKGGQCAGLTTLPPTYANCHEIWEPQPPGNLRACHGIALPLPYSLTPHRYCTMCKEHIVNVRFYIKENITELEIPLRCLLHVCAVNVKALDLSLIFTFSLLQF
jgi:hypothetical protein